MAERTNALVLKTRGGEPPVGSNPTAPAGVSRVYQVRLSPYINFLKIVKIMETFAFGFCTLWVPSPLEGESRLIGRRRRKKEDWMKRAIILVAVALVLMLVLAPVALAQGTTAMTGATAAAGGTTAAGGPLAPSGGPAILLPAAALLLGSGILTYAILRRR